jgi:hypothetical protein
MIQFFALPMPALFSTYPPFQNILPQIIFHSDEDNFSSFRTPLGLWIRDQPPGLRSRENRGQAQQFDIPANT